MARTTRVPDNLRDIGRLPCRVNGRTPYRKGGIISLIGFWNRRSLGKKQGKEQEGVLKYWWQGCVNILEDLTNSALKERNVSNPRFQPGDADSLHHLSPNGARDQRKGRVFYQHYVPIGTDLTTKHDTKPNRPLESAIVSAILYSQGAFTVQRSLVSFPCLLFTHRPVLPIRRCFGTESSDQSVWKCVRSFRLRGKVRGLRPLY